MSPSSNAISGGGAVDHAADGGAVALAPGGKAERGSEAVAGHGVFVQILPCRPTGPDRGRPRQTLRIEPLQQVGDLGSGLGLHHADHVIAGIDVMDFARDPAGEVRQQIKRGAPDLFGGHVAAQRRVQLVPFQDVAEIADAGGRQGLDRPRRDGIDPDVPVAQVRRQVAHARFERGLGDHP